MYIGVFVHKIQTGGDYLMDIIEAIKKAEEEAKENKMHAKLEINNYLNNCKQKALVKANEIISNAKEEARSYSDMNKKKIDSETLYFMQNCKQKDDKLARSCDSNIDMAVKFVLKQIEKE